jgi:hypothetical protein
MTPKPNPTAHPKNRHQLTTVYLLVVTLPDDDSRPIGGDLPAGDT